MIMYDVCGLLIRNLQKYNIKENDYHKLYWKYTKLWELGQIFTVSH